MQRSNKSANPFYLLLVPVGIVFLLTATAYGVMAFQARDAGRTGESTYAGHPLIETMRTHGNTALLVELGFLAACTVGAIATDEYWQRRQREEEPDGAFTKRS